MTTGRAAWDSLDEAWRAAFGQAWDAVRTGNIGVGAVATAPDGRIVALARNRVNDTDAPPGQVFGSSVAHAEVNLLAQLPFRHPRELVLTTTLQPCLQCSAAIRMGPIRSVRLGGTDPLWHGTDDFTSLNPWLARREPVPVEGPLGGRLGAFATLLSRLGPGLVDHVAAALRAGGESDLLDLCDELQGSGEVADLVAGDVDDALVALWDRLPGGGPG